MCSVFAVTRTAAPRELPLSGGALTLLSTIRNTLQEPMGVVTMDTRGLSAEQRVLGTAAFAERVGGTPLPRSELKRVARRAECLVFDEEFGHIVSLNDINVGAVLLIGPAQPRLCRQ